MVLSNPITMSSMPENHMVDNKDDESASMMLKMPLIYCLTLYKGSHLGFSQQYNVRSIFWPHHYVGHTRKPYSRHQNHESVTILKKMISIYCFTLNIWRPSWILPTMQCPKIRFGHTTVSGVPENLMVDTKITNLELFWRKWYQFIVWPWTYGGPLGFYTQCNVVKYVLAIPLCRAYQKTPW